LCIYTPNNNINSVDIYNNGNTSNGNATYITTTATNIKFYGKNNIFDNLNTRPSPWFWNLTTWSSNNYPNLWWTTWSLITSWKKMSRDYITNPTKTNNIYLLPWTGTWSNIKEYQTGFDTIAVANDYSFGSGIFTQAQPVYYSWTTLKTWWVFDATKYIGSDTIKSTWDLLGVNTATGLSFIVTGVSNNTSIASYSIFGNITPYRIGQTINTNTWITLSTWNGTKRIITQMFGTNYFATHFQKEIEVSTPIIYFTWSTPLSWTTLTGNNFKPQIEVICTGGINTFNYIFNSITYPYYDSGLVLMMNFDNISSLGETTGGIIKDHSQYANNGNITGQVVWTGNGRRNGAYIFNATGTNTYNGGVVITGIIDEAYKSQRGTIAYWINITKKDIGQWIFHMYTDNDPTTKYLRNYISTNNILDLVIEDNNTTKLNVSYDLDDLWNIEDQWLYTVWTQDGNGVKLYINWEEKNLWGTNTGSWWTNHLTGINSVWIGSARWSFSWSIDEIRIRNRALTSWQILQMRRSNFQKYDIDKWRFTDDRQCMWSGTYTYSWYVMNTLWLSATTGRFNLISIINPFVTPASYFIGTTWVSTTQMTLSGQFTWYFTVDDRRGTTGRYSTIQLPLTMTWVNYSTNKIINNGNNIKFMAAGLAITGSNTGNLVYINPDLSSYTWFTAPKQYIQRDYSQWYSCPSGIYGNKPHISIDIPGYQNPDTYSGTITIDISN